MNALPDLPSSFDEPLFPVAPKLRAVMFEFWSMNDLMVFRNQVVQDGFHTELGLEYATLTVTGTSADLKWLVKEHG